MTYRLRSLFIITAFAALVAWAFVRVPTITLSLVSLLPLPLVVGWLIIKRRQETSYSFNSLAVCAILLPAILLFYAGSIGPVTTTFLIVDENGFAIGSKAIDAMNGFYDPLAVLIERTHSQTLWQTLVQCQTDWNSLVS